MIHVTIKAKIYDTEDQEKVLKSIYNIINISQFYINKYITDLKSYFLYCIITNINEIQIVGPLFLLKKIYKNIRDLRIIESMRTVLTNNINKNKNNIYYTYVNLNKQVAYVNKINIVTNKVPLDPIQVKIISDKENIINQFINWITPETKNGEIKNQILKININEFMI